MYRVSLNDSRVFFEESGLSGGDVGLTVLNEDKSVKVARDVDAVLPFKTSFLANYTFSDSIFISGWEGYIKLDDTITEKFKPIKIL